MPPDKPGDSSDGVGSGSDGIGDGTDPHVHVGLDVVHGEAATRNILASSFGLAGDLPAAVPTGCGLRVPYAMTSPRPEGVTCLACRQYARDQCLRLADQTVRLAAMPGSPVTPAQAAQAAVKYRDLATKFASQ